MSKEEFEEIRIVGNPDPARVKAGNKTYTHIFFFPLTSAPPQRWNQLLVQGWIYRIMQNPRHIWVSHSELAIDCAGDELASIVERVGEDIRIVNRKCRKEVETNLGKTEQEREQAVEKKCLDDAYIRKVIDQLKVPG